MTRHRRKWNWRHVTVQAMLVSLFVALVVGFGGQPQTAFAQDAGLESLKRQSLPWYDAASEDIKPVEFEARDEPRSQLRGTIAKKVPRAKKKRRNGTFNNWGANWDGSIGTFFYWLMWAVLAVAFIILIVWAVRNVDVRPSFARDEVEQARSLAQSVAQLPFQVEIGNDDFRSLAKKAIQANDYRQAIVWLFSHVLVSLDQKNLIRLKKGKTNRQYLRELADERQLSDYYADVMLPFEATFFGDKELNQEQFTRCWNGLNQFEQQVEAAGEAL